MNRNLVMLLLLVSLIFISACQAESITVTPTEENTAIPSATATIAPTPTEIPISALTIEEISERFLSGEEIDISFMTDEQKRELSTYIVDQLNKARGTNPIIYNNEAYVDPSTGSIISIEDGATPEQQTEKMYTPSFTDQEGYRWVMDDSGEWIKIPNSRGIKWKITDNLDEANTLVTWPNGELSIISSGEFKGYSIPEYILAKEEPGLMLPVVLLDKNLGKIYLGEGGSSIPTQEILVIENSIVARKVIITGMGWFFKEGSSEEIGIPGYLDEKIEAFQQIKENLVYYLFLERNQKQAFTNRYVNRGFTEVTSGYHGLVPSSLTIDILSGIKQDNRFVWIDGIGMMEADN